MQCYIVRLIKTKELVGMYAASSKANLWDMVDECGDPGSCEYRSVNNGGLYLPESGAPTIKEYEDGDEYFDASWGRKHVVMATDKLFNDFCIKKNQRWVKMDYADEGVGALARIARETPA